VGGRGIRDQPFTGEPRAEAGQAEVLPPIEDRLIVCEVFGWRLEDIPALTTNEWRAVHYYAKSRLTGTADGS